MTATLSSASSTGSTDIVSYQWWLNGNIIGDGPTLTYTFPASGEYQVCLVIHTAGGCVSEDCHGVVVNNPTTPTCAAHFVYEIAANGTLYVNGASSTSNGDIASYQWTWGDGSSSTGNPTSHSYNASGTYTVCLLISTGNGCQDDICQTVTIPSNTEPTCEASFSYTIAGGVVSFISTSISNSDISGYTWSFGDGSSGSTAMPTHTYSEAGTYTVCLTITAVSGCVNEFCQTITLVSGGQIPQGNGMAINPNMLNPETPISLQLALSQDQLVQIGVVDASGQQIYGQKVTLPAGNINYVIENDAMVPGLYFVKIQFGDGSTGLKKVIIIN